MRYLLQLDIILIRVYIILMQGACASAPSQLTCWPRLCRLQCKIMALKEKSQTGTEEELILCSVSGSQSTPDRQRHQQREEQLDADPEEFVVVELVDLALHGAAPARQWTCSLPRVRFHTSNPAEGVDIAMEESGLGAAEPLTVGELVQRTVMRVPHHVALRYKTRGVWRDVTYRDYYNQCIAAAKSFLKVRAWVRGMPAERERETDRMLCRCCVCFSYS